MKNNIVVQKVDLNLYEMDRLKLQIKGKEEQIKYYQEEYIKLMHKLDSKENFGLNCLLFTYKELVEILQNKYHYLHDYIYRWFEPIYEDYCENDGTLYFAEEGMEVNEGDYWLVHVKNDYAIKLNDITKLNRKIYELEKEAK